MRRIPLKVIPVGQIQGQEIPDFDFADGIKMLIQFKQDGMQLEEMRKCTHIFDAVDTATSAKSVEVLLEEADWTYLNERLKAHKFPFYTKAYVELADAIEHATQVDINKPAVVQQAAE